MTTIEERIPAPGQAPASAVKLTEWVNEPTVSDLKEDLEASKSFHDDHSVKTKNWNDILTVSGAHKPKKVTGRSQVQPKLVRRQAEWRYSALTEPFLGSDKLFDVKPVTFEDKKAAEQNELVLNWQFRTKINRVNFIDNYVRTAVDEGSVVVRVGWNRITVEEEVEQPVWTHYAVTTQEQVQILDQANQIMQDDPAAFEAADPALKAAVQYMLETGQPNVAVQTGVEKVKVEKVIDNRPTLAILDPDNIYVDPSCGDDIEKALFVVTSFETSKAEMLKEPNRYKNLDAVNWETATVVTSTDHATNTPQTFNFKDILRKRVVAYEYWGLYDVNKNGTLVPIVATWVGDVMVRMEENPFPDKKAPFVLANYLPKKRELYGEPDAELLEDNQKVLGAVTRGMIDLLGRSANSQQGFAKGMLDVVNRRRFENGQDYEFNPNLNPTNHYLQHKYPEIPQSALGMVGIQNSEAEALTGVKSFSGGLSGEAYGDVAAGIRGVLDAAAKREMAILRRLAKGIIDIGRKIISMNGAFLSEKEVVRITNEQFIEVSRDELAGNFDLDVDISTAEVDSNKAQDLSFMLQTMGNNMDFGITKLILMEICRLKRMPWLMKAIEKYEPQPDPLKVKEQELIIEKLAAEIEQLKSNAGLNIAKTEKTEVEADKIDLDKTEQETGTEHERNLELQRAQGTANQDLEVTKSLLKPRKKADGSESEPDVDAAIGYKSIQPTLNKNSTGRPDMPRINQRDINAPLKPELNLGSKMYDPRLDPALNPALNL